jgi:hypothetical protein
MLKFAKYIRLKKAKRIPLMLLESELKTEECKRKMPLCNSEEEFQYQNQYMHKASKCSKNNRYKSKRATNVA